MARAARQRWSNIDDAPRQNGGPMMDYLRATRALLLQPITLLRNYPRSALGVDIIAGVTVGIVLLPQALAFSLLAGLPPAMGLYSAIVASIIGALWGSSSHVHSGPTNTASILTFSVLLPIAEPGSAQFIIAAGLVAVMAGIFRLAMGLARLGILVNFVSDSVAAGFTTGAGILIISTQIGPMLRVNLPPTTNLIDTLTMVGAHIRDVHLPSMALGLGTIVLIIVLKRLNSRLPTFLLGVVGASLIAWLFAAEQHGVAVLGDLPASLPPLTALPIFDLELIGNLANGALALAIIGLVEAVSIARAISSQSRQRLDSNQEFVGQGLANIAAGIFSGYPCSGSFNRSVLSFQSGALTAVGNAISGLTVLAASLLLAPLISHLARPVLAGAIALTAYSMIDHRTIARLWRGAKGDALIMFVTLGATLLLPLQFAVLIGVLMSLGYYLLKTSTPQVRTVLPDAAFQNWLHQPDQPLCPQLGVVEVLGDIYFGAVSHVEDRIDQILAANPRQRFLLLRLHSVQHCDISGIRALENIRQTCRNRGGDLFLVYVRAPVMEVMHATGFYERLGADHFLEKESAASYLFHKVLDPAICIYECEVRAFLECQSLPKQTLPELTLPPQISMDDIPAIAARDLWNDLRNHEPVVVVDVREPREFRQGHIPSARLIPLRRMLTERLDLPRSQRIVLVCRNGSRSARAAAHLLTNGFDQVYLLRDGLVSWEAAQLLQATELPRQNEGDPTEIEIINRSERDHTSQSMQRRQG